MGVLSWSEELNVGVAFMDDDHAEAARLINALAEAEGDALKALFAEFLHHTEEHFGREEEMMRHIHFFAYGPHKGEHDRVLDELRAVEARIAAGETETLQPYFTEALPQWLLTHRNTMDAITAQVARQAGYRG